MTCTIWSSSPYGTPTALPWSRSPLLDGFARSGFPAEPVTYDSQQVSVRFWFRAKIPVISTRWVSHQGRSLQISSRVVAA